MSEVLAAVNGGDAELIEELARARQRIAREIAKRVVGQEGVIEQLLIALFSRGHCLFVGVPGLAKTLMVSSISQILDVAFKRIQFTPDLMPSDITGTTVLDEQEGRREFRYVKGPIFANIILADEINRTPPKTQAALLEAMQERQVTVGRVRHRLADPFFVLATQNPIEQEGTYPLPEAQLDRFLFLIKVEYPTDAEEEQIMRMGTGTAQAAVSKVLHGEDIIRLQHIVRRVPVADHVFQYAKRITRLSRPGTADAADFVNKWLTWGAGPRASMNMILAAKAHAVLQDRQHVSADDVAAVADPILRHRLIPNFTAQSEGVTVENIIQRLLKAVPKNQAA